MVSLRSLPEVQWLTPEAAGIVAQAPQQAAPPPPPVSQPATSFPAAPPADMQPLSAAELAEAQQLALRSKSENIEGNEFIRMIALNTRAAANGQAIGA